MVLCTLEPGFVVDQGCSVNTRLLATLILTNRCSLLGEIQWMDICQKSVTSPALMADVVRCNYARLCFAPPLETCLARQKVWVTLQSLSYPARLGIGLLLGGFVTRKRCACCYTTLPRIASEANMIIGNFGRLYEHQNLRLWTLGRYKSSFAILTLWPNCAVRQWACSTSSRR